MVTMQGVKLSVFIILQANSNVATAVSKIKSEKNISFLGCAHNVWGTKYSTHPKAKPCLAFEFNLMPVPIIR
jgi:hypothetical protein